MRKHWSIQMAIACLFILAILSPICAGGESLVPWLEKQYGIAEQISVPTYTGKMHRWDVQEAASLFHDGRTLMLETNILGDGSLHLWRESGETLIFSKDGSAQYTADSFTDYSKLLQSGMQPSIVYPSYAIEEVQDLSSVGVKDAMRMVRDYAARFGVRCGKPSLVACYDNEAIGRGLQSEGVVLQKESQLPEMYYFEFPAMIGRVPIVQSGWKYNGEDEPGFGVSAFVNGDGILSFGINGRLDNTRMSRDEVVVMPLSKAWDRFMAVKAKEDFYLWEIRFEYIAIEQEVGSRLDLIPVWGFYDYDGRAINYFDASTGDRIV